MAALTTIVVKDLRQRLRDRSILIFGVLSPLALAAIFALVLPSFGSEDIRIGLVAEADDPVAAGLAEGLEQADGLTIMRLDGLAAAERAVEDGAVGAAVVVPAGLLATVRSGEEVTFEVLAPPDGGLSALVAEGVAEGIASNLRTSRLAAAVAAQEGLGPAEVEQAATSAALAEPALQLQDRSAEDNRLDPTSYLAAAMAVFFVFFVVQFGLASLLEERQQGTLQRLLAAPIRPGLVIVAKVVTSIVVGLGSMAVLLVASRLLLGARFGDPLGVAVLTLAAVLAAVGIMAVVGAFATTPDQANGAQAVVGIVLGMLGGAFFPVGDDGILGLLSRISPHRWYLQGLGDLGTSGTVADVATHVGVLLVFAVVGFAAGAAVLRVRPLEVR